MSQPTEQNASASLATAPADGGPTASATDSASTTTAPAPVAVVAPVPAQAGDAAVASTPAPAETSQPVSSGLESSAAQTSSDALPLTQEPPAPTQSSTATAAVSTSQALAAGVPESLPPTQPTVVSSGSAPSSAPQRFESTSAVGAPPSVVASTAPSEPATLSQSAGASPATTVADPAPFAALAISPTSHAFAKVEPVAAVIPVSNDSTVKTNGGSENGQAAQDAKMSNGAPPASSQPGAPAGAVAPVSAPSQAPDSTGSRVSPGVVRMSSAQIKYAQNSLRALKVRGEARWFLDPVDPVALNIPSYPLIVKEPMDLGTIEYKLSLTSFKRTAQASNNPAPRPSEKVRQALARNLDPNFDYYATVDDFARDMNLVFDNCARFNGEEHQITKHGRDLQKQFHKQLAGMPTIDAETEKKLNAGYGSPTSKPRAPSTSLMPAARRPSTTDAASRPKREVGPPPSRDLAWDDDVTNVSGPSIAMKRRRTTMTPREQAHFARINSEDLRFAQKVMDELYKPAHQNIAWVFYDLPDTTLDFAPAYYEMIKQPMSMRKIQMKLKAGEFADLADFDAAWQLLFRNCFTFNPPDTDVYEMGKKMKDIYEEKMRKRPTHAPLSPDPLEDIEMGEVDDEESRLAEIHAQIAKLKAEAASLQSEKAKPAKKKVSSGVAGPSSKKAKIGSGALDGGAPFVPPVNGGAPKLVADPSIAKPARKKSKPKDVNGAAAGSSKKKSGASSPTRRTSGAGGANGAPKKPRRESQTARVEAFREITYPQKEELAMKIQELPEDRLDGALSIIAEDKPPSAGDQDEIELDIDAISPQTLYKLYTYVVGPLPPVNGGVGTGGADGSYMGDALGAGSKKKKSSKKGKPASGAGAADGRKRGTGGLKRKNLDEEEEAQRIASLRQQLDQFNSGDVSVGASTSALPVDGAHDDLVHSDSSSGDESGSDSESDYD